MKSANFSKNGSARNESIFGESKAWKEGGKLTNHKMRFLQTTVHSYHSIKMITSARL